MPLARNMELKARLRDLGVARETARQLATEYVGVQLQTDTYFHCRSGRLKLREIAGQTAQLVSYERPDRLDAKGSDYRLIEVHDAAALKDALTSALGVLVVVAKRREIYLVENVRVHLDEVEELGSFLEFEAVLNSEIDDAAGQRQVATLQKAFNLELADCRAESYSDMLLATQI
jgi:adenylate cyclase class 2